MDGNIYEFEDYLLDVSEQRLQKDGEDISLPPKVFAVLASLVKNQHQLVSYDNLMEEVWGDTFVEESNLRYCIHTLRKTFTEDFIETVPKHGYRFNASVKEFTKEEFIERHLKNNQIDAEKAEVIPKKTAEEDLEKTTSFISKPISIVAISVLMAVIGIFAFYSWQNRNSYSTNENTRTIAVVPFNIIGESEEQKKVIHESLLDSLDFNLGKIKGIDVKSSKKDINPSTEQFDALKFGNELDSDLVLEGSYQFEKNQTALVNTKLLDVSTGETLFNYEFAVNETSKINAAKIISLRTARKIYDYLTVIEDEKFIKTQDISEESRRNYLSGQRILRNFEYYRWTEGVTSFKKIVEAEPNWAKGYAKYAEALVLIHGGIPDFELVKQVADKALKLDENLPEAHLAKGFYYKSKFQWKESEKSFIKAIELDPKYSNAYIEYALILDNQRKFAKADEQYKKAIYIKPFDPFYKASQCDHFYLDEKFDKAKSICKEAIDIDPKFGMSHKNLFWIHVALGDYESMFKAEFGRLSESEIKNKRKALALKNGNLSEYWELRINDRQKNKNKRASPFSIAAFYAQLNDKENTLKYLEETFKLLPGEITRINAEPMFKFVSKEPRFIELLRKCNLK